MEDFTSNNKQFNYPEYSILGPELTSFVLQVGFVEGIVSESMSYSSISEAFRHLFRNNKEYAVILWNGIPLRLSYKDDIPNLAEEIVVLLEAVQSKQKNIEVQFKAENIELILNGTLNENDLTLKAKFIKVPAHYESAFVPLSILKIGRTAFLREWKMLLSQYVEAINSSNYKLRSIKANTTMRRLIQLNDSIEQRGRLYS